MLGQVPVQCKVSKDPVLRLVLSLKKVIMGEASSISSYLLENQTLKFRCKFLNPYTRYTFRKTGPVVAYLRQTIHNIQKQSFNKNYIDFSTRFSFVLAIKNIQLHENDSY